MQTVLVIVRREKETIILATAKIKQTKNGYNNNSIEHGIHNCPWYLPWLPSDEKRFESIVLLAPSSFELDGLVPAKVFGFFAAVGDMESESDTWQLRIGCNEPQFDAFFLFEPMFEMFVFLSSATWLCKLSWSDVEPRHSFTCVLIEASGKVRSQTGHSILGFTRVEEFAYSFCICCLAKLISWTPWKNRKRALKPWEGTLWVATGMGHN